MSSEGEMIEIKPDKTIIISRGDKFELNAILENYQPVTGDEYFFSLKHCNNIILSLQATVTATEDGLNLYFVANTEQVKVLTTKNYIYDIYVENNGELKTVMFTADFIVKEVAHNV